MTLIETSGLALVAVLIGGVLAGAWFEERERIRSIDALVQRSHLTTDEFTAIFYPELWEDRSAISFLLESMGKALLPRFGVEILRPSDRLHFEIARMVGQTGVASLDEILEEDVGLEGLSSHPRWSALLKAGVLVVTLHDVIRLLDSRPSLDSSAVSSPLPSGSHRHLNGGGLVADTAVVDAAAYVGPQAAVLDNAKVRANSSVTDRAVVYDFAVIQDSAHVGGHARVFGNAIISPGARVYGDAFVGGNHRVAAHEVVPYGDLRRRAFWSWLRRTEAT